MAKGSARGAGVRECLVPAWFGFGSGRTECQAEACSLKSLQSVFEASGGNIRALLLALTQTDTFMYRPAVVPVEAAP